MTWQSPVRKEPPATIMVEFRFESFGFGSIASPMRCSHATDLTRKLRTFSQSEQDDRADVELSGEGDQLRP